MRVAQDLWAVSDRLLDVMIGIEEMQKGMGQDRTLAPALKLVLEELSGWGLDSKEGFRNRHGQIMASMEVLRRRDDNYAAWGKPGQTVDDLYDAMYCEYENLQRILSNQEADLEKGKKFCTALHKWCCSEVMEEHNRRYRERYPLRRFASA